MHKIAAAVLMVMIGACVPVPPAPIAQPLLPVVSPPSSGGSQMLEKVKDVVMPDAPKSSPELPKIRILSNPRHVLTVSTFTVPQTIRLEGDVENHAHTGGIRSYHWRIWKLGVPLISEDQLVQEAEGRLIAVTISEVGRYRIRLTVTTDHGDQVSASLHLWGRN